MVEESSPPSPPAEESIGPETDSALESELEVDELSANPGGEPAFVCGCEKWMRSACKGLPFYKEQEDKRYCVLHYPGKEKSAGFRAALDSKLNKKDFDFQGVWFPDEVDFRAFQFGAAVDFSYALFSAAAYFRFATFSAGASFRSATFSTNSDFRSATFSGNSDFNSATFRGALDFSEATLNAYGDFSWTTFSAGAHFNSATFQTASFSGARFSDTAIFDSASFRSEASFLSVRFDAEANFTSVVIFGKGNFSFAIFSRDAQFAEASFQKEAAFTEALFKGTASFSRAIFETDVDFRFGHIAEGADFYAATIKGASDFSSTNFGGMAKFSSAALAGTAAFAKSIFNARADFSGTTFGNKVDFSSATFMDYGTFVGFKGIPIFNFDSVRIESPDRFFFPSLELRPHWFIEVDASKLDLANVEWPNNLDKEIESLRGTKTGRSMAVVYRRLAISAEEAHRYEVASMFRYASMEMRRPDKWEGLKLWKTDWIYQLYWTTSGYGERILRAIFWLFAIWLLFAALYTQIGFVRWEPKTTNETDAGSVQIDSVGAPLSRSRAAIYSLAVMSLQKPNPSPATRTAQTCVLLETVLGPVQAALLLLAIRRKFMR
jgi:hypothetical protein